MPAAVRYIDPNSALRKTSGIDSPSERREREEAFKKSRDYYDGKHKRFLDVKPGEPDDNVVINVTRMAVDRTTTFLFPQMPALELAPKETGETEDEEWLRNAWEFNGGVVFLQDVVYNGALSGHNFVRVLPPKNGEQYPRLINIDPLTILPYWKADDLDVVLWYELYWTVQEGNVSIEYLQDIIFIEDEDRWEIRQYVRQSGGKWLEDLENFQRWDFKYGPIINWKHLPNPNRFYGKQETDHIDLNDKLNLIVSENARINRYHSSPKTVATGVAPDKIKQTAIDDLWATENKDAKVYNLEMRSDQQFSQSLATFLYDTYLAESRVVLLRGEVKDFQRVTNAGVRTVFIDMLSKNAILRRLYGNAIQKISRVMGMVSGMGEDMIPDVVHADPLPVDDKELVNTAAVERAMGVVSRQTISEKRGYVWQDELDRQTEEAQLDVFAPPPAPGGGSSGLADTPEEDE